MTGQAQYQDNMSPDRRFQTINAATSIPSNYNLNEAAEPPQPPMNAGRGQYGSVGGVDGQQPPVGYGYGQQQQFNGPQPPPPPMQSGPYGGGYQPQQQYPSWARSTVAPWSPSSEQVQRAATAVPSNANQGAQTGYNPRPDGQAMTDAQRAAQSMRDETAGRSSPSGTVEERRAQKIREAQSAFRNAASRDRFGFGMGGGGMSGFAQQMPMQQPMGYGYSMPGQFGDASYGRTGMGGQYDMGIPYGNGAGSGFGVGQFNQGTYGSGVSPSFGGLGSQSFGQQSMYGAGGGSGAVVGFGGGYGYGYGAGSYGGMPWGGQQQDEFVEHVRMAEQQREYEKEMKRQFLDEARRNQQQRLELPPSGMYPQEPQMQSPQMQGQGPSQPSTPPPQPPFQQPPSVAPAPSKAGGSNSYLDSISSSPPATPDASANPANVVPTYSPDVYTSNSGPYPMPPPFQSGIQQW